MIPEPKCAIITVQLPGSEEMAGERLKTIAETAGVGPGDSVFFACDQEEAAANAKQAA